jgi:hypothetical protein
VLAGLRFRRKMAARARVFSADSRHQEPTIMLLRSACGTTMCLIGKKIVSKEKVAAARVKQSPRPISACFQKHADFDPR